MDLQSQEKYNNDSIQPHHILLGVTEWETGSFKKIARVTVQDPDEIEEDSDASF